MNKLLNEKGDKLINEKKKKGGVEKNELMN